MAIDFPNSPTTGDTYTTGGRTWQWDGTTWKSYGNYPDPTVLKIDPANNRVGVNNTSPAVTLDVTGDLTASGTITGGLISGDAMTIPSYADSAARTTAIPSPTEANFSYLQDTNSVEVYDGTQWTALAGGPIVQMVVATTTTSTTTTSTTYVDTTLSASITPTDSSSNIYVLMTGHVRPRRTAADNSGWGYMNIVRGTTQIAETASRIDVGGTGTTQQQSPAAVSILDSPATTSTVTYKVQIKSSSPAETVFSGQGFASTITLIEVSG